MVKLIKNFTENWFQLFIEDKLLTARYSLAFFYCEEPMLDIQISFDWKAVMYLLCIHC